MEYIIGVDGGGTKTTATLYNNKMEVLGHFLGGPMNLQVVSEEKVKDVFQKMLNHFNLKSSAIKIGVGAAGAGRPEDVAKLEAILKDIGFKKYSVSSDAHIGLLAIHGKNSGMMIISGTGSIGFAIKDFTLYRKGGWGHLLGDEGSGYFMGLSLSKELFRSFDKDEPFPEKVLKDILELTNSKNSGEFLKWIYRSDKGEIAKLSSIVLKNSDYKVTKNIIDSTVEALKNLVLDLKRATNLNSVGFIGGIIENDTIIREKLLLELKNLNIEFVERKYTNEYGATLLLES
ncbi:N-acetylglucosamine kinase [Cetobacterium sp.]|uniref:N-acetylglucosamine kinase n=1 Tax=Cetobacterium sp. TaxID=2071632 RepID=UPI003F3CA5C5